MWRTPSCHASDIPSRILVNKASSAPFTWQAPASPLSCRNHRSRNRPWRSAAARFRAKPDPSIRVRGFICSATASRTTANCGSSALQQFAKLVKDFFFYVYLYRTILCLIHTHALSLRKVYPATTHVSTTPASLTTSPPPQPWAQQTSFHL